VDKFQHNQRVLVRKTCDDVIFAPPISGTVKRICIADDGAWIALDEKPSALPEARVMAYPEDCDPMEPSVARKLCRVGVDQFGRDHESALLYIESRCVDYCGILDNRHMRANPARHPAFAHLAGWNEEHGTRLKDGSVVGQHDDWDCIDDLEVAGMVCRGGTSIAPVFSLTTKGWKCAGSLRREKAERTRC